MKTIYLLLSIYILALSMLPCRDVRDCNADNFVIERSANHESHDHEQESCSPFCICACCGTTAIHLLNVYEMKIAEIKLDRTFPFSQPDISEISLSIWQPPKLS